MSSTVTRRSLMVDGMPDCVSPTDAAICRSRLIRDVEALMLATSIEDINLSIGTTQKDSGSLKKKDSSAVKESKSQDGNEIGLEDRAKRYQASAPLWPLEHLVVPSTVSEELQLAIETIRLEPLVFDKWGLRAIEPFPRSALNFHGLPGTGKTLAAHGIAANMGKNILVATYAQIESMYHGEGPKNVEALFHAAERDEGVLFIDEADSLLSKRLTNVTQGSEQAINSMRSQLLICMENYRGIVIFATNLVTNYDQAFETRIRHIHFPMPDQQAREVIWQRHLPSSLPLAADVNIPALAAAEEEFCGRDIKNAVINAALSTARKRIPCLTQDELLDSIRRIVTAREALRNSNQQPVSENMSERIKAAVNASEHQETAEVTTETVTPV